VFLSDLYNYFYLVADFTAAVKPIVSARKCLGMWTYYNRQDCNIQRNWNSARRDQQSSNSKCQHMGTSFATQTSAI